MDRNSRRKANGQRNRGLVALGVGMSLLAGKFLAIVVLSASGPSEALVDPTLIPTAAVERTAQAQPAPANLADQREKLRQYLAERRVRMAGQDGDAAGTRAIAWVPNVERP